MSPIGISLAFAVAFGLFAWLAWRKLAIVAALQPDLRWDEPVARLKRVVVNGFLQSRMLSGDFKPGVMHTVIFAGFLILLVRKVQLLVIGWYEPFVYPGVFGAGFAWLKDVVELAVLAAVGFGFWRRFWHPARRLEPNREALAILGLITAIMVTDFLFDGFRFALLSDAHPGIAHERGYAFAGNALAGVLATLPPAVQQVGYHLSYWVQMLTVFAFLVWLPLGEHFHIVTALPGLFFARRPAGPLNTVPAVNLEPLMNEGGDEEIRVGIRTAKDLSWKDAYDAFTCTECGRCKSSCPTFLTGKPLSLKWVNDSLKKHLLAEREHILHAGEEALPPLAGKVISDETLWACTTCGYCESACPIELEHLGKFFKLRQHRVMMDGEFPHELKNVFEAYEATSNPWGLPQHARADWAKGLDVPVVTTREQVEALDYLFYVGSAQSYDPRGQKIARAFVQVLRAAGVKFGILGGGETSTGECVRRAGNEMLFQTLAPQLIETLNRLGVKRIVTCDPHAYNSLKNEYPAFGGKYELIHHTQLIAQLLAAGRLEVAPQFERVVLHDPCYLGRHNGEFDAPRAVLARVARAAPLEFELNRERAMCCGAGGGRMWMEEHIGTRINVARVEQALPLAPKTIATACPYCAVMVADGLSAVGQAEQIETRDLAELVAAALVAKG
ncbi:MAG: (Fe-S)-binding protein [Gemmatimonadota bacterium]